MKHVFIIGSKGIPANYGGYETFVDKLTEYSQNNNDIHYYVACKNSKDVLYNNASCFGVDVPNIGPAQAILYDLKALDKCIEIIKKNNIENPFVYVLACRIGPFFNHYIRKIHKLGGEMYINPDGHEWKRAKWNGVIKKYWKYSEKLMVKNADLIICDSLNIEKYINREYEMYHPNTTYISYGAEINKSNISETNWFKDHGVNPKEYYLVVGRFVPENNYETMIKEFMKSSTKKDFVLVTGVNDKFLNELENKLHYKKDKRIKFVGTVYDQQLLKKIREEAFAYIHGHEVGGTNPSLLEALASTDLNLLLDVGFNKEVGEDSCLYWNKEDNNLCSLINKLESNDENISKELGLKAKEIIRNRYSWNYIVEEYNKVFCHE